MSVVVTQPEAGGVTARRAVLAVAVLLAAAVGVAALLERDRAVSTAPSASSTAATGGVATAPAFSLPSLRSEGQVTLAAQPGKPTVVNFFAAWCVPCREELPALREAARANPEVAFLGVDHLDSRDDAIAMLDEFGIAYPAGYDPNGEIATKFRLRGLPATVFIDPDGRVVEIHQGALAAKDLADGLRKLALQGGSA